MTREGFLERRRRLGGLTIASANARCPSADRRMIIVSSIVRFAASCAALTMNSLTLRPSISAGALHHRQRIWRNARFNADGSDRLLGHHGIPAVLAVRENTGRVNFAFPCPARGQENAYLDHDDGLAERPSMIACPAQPRRPRRR